MEDSESMKDFLARRQHEPRPPKATQRLVQRMDPSTMVMYGARHSKSHAEMGPSHPASSDSLAGVAAHRHRQRPNGQPSKIDGGPPPVPSPGDSPELVLAVPLFIQIPT